MGGQAGKYVKKGVDYVTGVTDDQAETSTALSPQTLHGFSGTPFVLYRTSSLCFDEDGHLAHEFYKESRSKQSNGKVRLKRITKGLRPQGKVKLDIPRLHVEFPVVIYEG